MYQYPSNPSPKRWTKADNGRVLPLNREAWRKLRRSILDAEPLCRMCTAQGLTVIATDLDHRDNNPANNELVNLQPLCHSCHSHKTMRDMGHNVRMGCATDGTPLDYQHHWNNATGAVLARPAAEKSLATDGAIPTVLPSFNAKSKACHENCT